MRKIFFIYLVMKHILVSGSSAIDRHMHFPESFETFFSQGNLKQRVNFSAISDTFEENLGGTGANICYNLGILAEPAILLSSVSRDYHFAHILREKSILKYVHKSDSFPTAQSSIIHDSDWNRMEFFYQGAMKEANESSPHMITESLGVAIISAGNVPTMLEHAKYLSDTNIPIIVDPAQQISQMDALSLREFLSYGNIFIGNEYEFSEVQNKLEISGEEFINLFENVIVSRGEKGVRIYKGDSHSDIPSQIIEEVEDTTGAGDALRAGILYGMIEGWNIEDGCRLGNILAGYCIIASGSQNHHAALGNLMEDMKDVYNANIDLFTKRKY